MRNGLVRIDALDGLGKDGRNRKGLDFAAGGILGEGYGIKNDKLFDRACFKALKGRAGKNAMGGAGINFSTATLFYKSG